MLIDLVVKVLAKEVKIENPIVSTFQQRIIRAMDLVEKRLSTNEYFAGSEFTAADIMMVFFLIK